MRGEFTELFAGLGVEEDPEVGANEGEVMLVGRGSDQEGGRQLDRRGFGDLDSLTEGCSIDEGRTLVGGFKGDSFTTFDQGKGWVGFISGQGGGKAVN